MSVNRFTTTPALGLLAALAGCTVGPHYTAPTTTAPAAYASLDAHTSGMTSVPNAGAASVATWWTQFNDPTLNSLIERATAGNLDLRIARARLREARALRGVAGGQLQPQLNAAADAKRLRASRSLGGPTSGDGDGTDYFDAGLDASWELDVFGGLRRGVEAADADVAAAHEQQRDSMVTLAAEVARNYTEYRSLQQRIGVATRTIAAQQETLGLSESRFNAGISAEIEAQQARAQLATRESQLPPLQASARNAAHRLAVLLGQQPEALLQELNASGTIPTAPAEVPVGLPSELLRRRPDIRRDERALAAATARVGVATAELYPKFSLTGAFGWQSASLASLPDSESIAASIGPTMRWKLFSGGQVRAQIEAAGAREEQALLKYDQTVLRALEEVESSLASFVHEQGRRAALGRSVDANRRAVDLATERWKAGIGDFLTVLVNQRQLFDAEDSLVQSEAGVTQSLIQLYKALGGGWSETPEGPATPPATPPATSPVTAPAGKTS